MDIEEFDKHAYAYRAWPGGDQDGVVARFSELCVYVESLIAAEREACAKVCDLNARDYTREGAEVCAAEIRQRSNAKLKGPLERSVSGSSGTKWSGFECRVRDRA